MRLTVVLIERGRASDMGSGAPAVAAHSNAYERGATAQVPRTTR
jgi:hypothetical protein